MFCENCGNKTREKINFCTKCGNKFEQISLINRLIKFFISKKFIFILFILVILVVSYLYLQQPNLSEDQLNLNIASSVVNIYCEDKFEGDGYGGSGTIWTEDGLILTNAHIIPESAFDDVYINETTCIVILPDPSTGSPDEIYYAYPILIPEISEQYDLAFMQIHDVYYDDEENVTYGEYPKEFPIHEDAEKCSEDYIKLGEPVVVYGYPSISGGYALTLTDGIVSSLLPEEGLIITSAKISYGNSGGLAVDQNGCMLGVPSMVIGDENESLGVIISNELINEFITELEYLTE